MLSRTFCAAKSQRTENEGTQHKSNASHGVVLVAAVIFVQLQKKKTKFMSQDVVIKLQWPDYTCNHKGCFPFT